MQTSKTKESHNPPKKQNLNAQIGSTKERSLLTCIKAV